MKLALAECDLVERLYGGAVSRSELEIALGHVVKYAGASGGNIHVVDKTTLASEYFLTSGPNYTDKAIADYFEYWRHVNVHRAAIRRTEGVFLCHEHLADDVLERAAYAQDFYFKMGERWLAGAVSRDDPRYEVSFVLNRSADHSKFDASSKRLIADLLPHARRVASIVVAQGRQHALGNGLYQAWSRHRRPAWVVDRKLRIVWLNCAAEDALSAGRGFLPSAAYLWLADANAQTRLGELVSGACNRLLDAGLTESVRCQVGDRLGFEFEVTPATAPGFEPQGPRALALVLARRLGLHAGAAQFLREAYPLSPHEAHVAVELAHGSDLGAIAQQRGVAVETVRTQLRSIFAKTGATRQAELVALVWRLCA